MQLVLQLLAPSFLLALVALPYTGLQHLMTLAPVLSRTA